MNTTPWNSLLSKILTVSGGVAVTLIGVAIYRRRLKKALATTAIDSQTEWETEKAILQKDKELLEQKLFELENILERMSKEIESLKASLKDKQKAVNAQEAEKERLQEQERKLRKESETTIEQLQRRAQHFLRELEAKSLLCDSQSQHIALVEATNKQLLQEKELLTSSADQKAELTVSEQLKSELAKSELIRSELILQLQALRTQHDQLQEEVVRSRDQVLLDVRYLLDSFVFKRSSSNLPKISPLIIGLENTQEPALVSICKRYHYHMHYDTEHSNGTGPIQGQMDGNNGTMSFSVSVDGTKTGALVATHM